MSLSEQPSTCAHLENLNAPQREAVQHKDGPILILAGAGSGKTRVLTRRVAHLVVEHGVRPGSILAVTFTNKATNEMKERLAQLLGEQAARLWVSTFHSAALRILRRHSQLLGYSPGFVVYDEQDTKTLLKNLLKDNSIDEKRYPVSYLKQIIQSAKNRMLSVEEFSRAGLDSDPVVADIYAKYQRALFDANAMDFGDLLFNAVRLFSKHPEVLAAYQERLNYVLVDEFQDTNPVQYELIRLLTQRHKNLLVVGDDDQSIYAFRGATIRNILEFEKDFPDTTVVKLEQNYRSTSRILDAGYAVICRNTGRKEKRLWTEAPLGEKIQAFLGFDETDEAEFIAQEILKLTDAGRSFSEIAVFYRTNAQSRAIEEALIDCSIPYRIYGGLKFYDRKEIKDILAYLKLLTNPSDTQSFLRVINTPPRGIGPRTLRSIIEAAQQNACNYMEACEELRDSSKSIAEFFELMNSFRKTMHTTPLSQLIADILERSDYRARLEASKDISAQSRLENLQELQAIALSMEMFNEDPAQTLQDFLDRVSLASSADLPEEEAESSDTTENFVSLTTLHLAKGLEFSVVFLSGMEEGLLPHSKSMDPDGVEEERRLCYVGITRARELLYLSRTMKRGMFSAGGEGFGMYREASRFAFDIPKDSIEQRGKDFFAGMSWEESQEDSTAHEFSVELESQVPAFAIQRKKNKSRTKSTSLASLGLKSAASLADKTYAQAEDLGPGVRVEHPSFGRGVVQAVEGNTADNPGNVKVLVHFDEYAQAKKLVLKHAKLSVIEEEGHQSNAG